MLTCIIVVVFKDGLHECLPPFDAFRCPSLRYYGGVEIAKALVQLSLGYVVQLLKISFDLCNMRNTYVISELSKETYSFAMGPKISMQIVDKFLDWTKFQIINSFFWAFRGVKSWITRANLIKISTLNYDSSDHPYFLSIVYRCQNSKNKSLKMCTWAAPIQSLLKIWFLNRKRRTTT